MPGTIQAYHTTNDPVTTGRKPVSRSRILRGNLPTGTHLNWLNFFGRYRLGLAAYAKKEGVDRFCVSATPRGRSVQLHSIRVEIEDFGMRTIVQASEQLCARSISGKMMCRKENCNDFITTSGGRAWQTCANGLRRNQAETRIGGRPTISVVFSMKTGGRKHFVQFCGQCFGGDVLRKRKETVAQRGEDVLRKERRRKLCI